MCESKELQTTEQKPSIQCMNVHDMRERREIIGTMMRSVMQPKIHFGKIPGCGDKPTLLKPGAEMICSTFGLVPTLEITMRELQNGHREYEIKCTIVSISTGQVLGSGVGMCSTLEKKYRFRNDYVNTGKNVPREYWDNHDISLLGGRGFCAKKDDSGAWKIFKTSGEVENQYLADTYNTVLKMSKKRAFIDAVLTVTGCSEFFTQDIEDFPAYRDAEFVPEDADPQPNQNKPSAPTAPKSAQHPAQTNAPLPHAKKARTPEEIKTAFYAYIQKKQNEFGASDVETVLEKFRDDNGEFEPEKFATIAEALEKKFPSVKGAAK